MNAIELIDNLSLSTIFHLYDPKTTPLLRTSALISCLFAVMSKALNYPFWFLFIWTAHHICCRHFCKCWFLSSYMKPKLIHLLVLKAKRNNLNPLLGTLPYLGLCRRERKIIRCEDVFVPSGSTGTACCSGKGHLQSCFLWPKIDDTFPLERMIHSYFVGFKPIG